ncbi:MAG: hypothetical protein PHC95_13385 [Parabacteroides sp.]|nr:hypothetical protein [Parabacteroides sp.]
MKHMKSLLALTSSALIILSACNTNKAKEQAAVGSDRDEHDCIGSAGYVWSEVREDCIRPFEAGVKLRDRKNADATTAAFLVFATDSLKAELFLPTVDKGIVLDKQDQAWSYGSYRAYLKEGKWTVDEKDALIYAE